MRKRRATKPLAVRFAEKWIPDRRTGCWIWVGSRRPSGYGQMGSRGASPVGADRVSYELHVGEIPPGMFVLHRCDRPPCVNPDHLFLGSHQDNMDNMGAKGRRHDRERHPGARLTWEEVRAIRGLDAAGETHGAIANQLGVSRATVGSIVRGNIWDEPTYVPPRARRKGPRPESARTAKLTWGSVKDIRSRLSAGETPMSLATTYGVSRESIYAIRSGDTWKETT